MRAVDVDAMADVAKHSFAKYSGPQRTVAITLRSLEDVAYEIRDGSNAVLETGSVPIVEKLDSLAVYNFTGRFLADRLANLNRAQIEVVAYNPVGQLEADLFRGIAFEGIPDSGPLTIQVALMMSARPVNGMTGSNGAYAPPVNLSERNAFYSSLSPAPSNPASPSEHYSYIYPPSMPTDTYFQARYTIRDASGKILEMRSSKRINPYAEHGAQYRDIVKEIAKRVGELRTTTGS